MRTQNTISGHIAVRPSTLHYIQWRERLAPGAPLDVPGKSPFGAFLESQFSFCILFHSEGFFPPPPAPALAGYSERLPFVAHGPLASQHLFQLMDHVAARLDAFCYHLLYDDLIREIIAGKMDGGQERRIVEDFLRARGLEDDITWDAAIKAVYRIRQGRGYPSFRGNSVQRHFSAAAA